MIANDKNFSKKRFLFLQGPHGPFFFQLSRMLNTAGFQTTKIGFNQGDRFFWRDKASYTAYVDTPENWEGFIAEYLRKGVTDLVIYGDTRPVHVPAVKSARKLGIRIHCFEEGYLRPYWITYERDGVNGHSRLMNTSLSDMEGALQFIDSELPEAPARWGEMRQHILLGAIYHWQILFRNWRYKNFRSHRNNPVSHEFWLHFKRLVSRPHYAYRRWVSTREIKRNGYIYHLGLLQLGHDASIQSHSPFENMPEFMRLCVEAFAKGAPKHHHLVFKAHPLEDGGFPLAKIAERLALQNNLKGRVHYVRGGKLAALLDYARSVVTINSTAAQQALWRGLPVRTFGESVYRKPEFTSEQPLPDFFANPKKPEMHAYRVYRQYLLATSQITGGFYSRKSRVRLTRTVVDMMLADLDPYENLEAQTGVPLQQLRVVN